MHVAPLKDGPMDVALCIDAVALSRLRATLRHLCVGLVDHPVRLRLVSDTPQIDDLALGPVQSVIHRRLRWPVSRHRTAQLLDRLREDPPELVHAVSRESYALASRLADRLDVGLILDVGSVDDCRAAAELRTRPNTRFIAFSTPLAELLASERAVGADRIDLIRPGVISEHDPDDARPWERPPTILSILPFEPSSELDVLIRALGLLRDRGCGFAAFLVGEGAREAHLRALVRAGKLQSCVTFASPAVPASELMQAGDVLAVPARLEFVSIRILQGMAACMTVVACPSLVNDSLTDGRTCILSSPTSPESFADALQVALTDRARARTVAEGGLQHVLEHHTVSGMAERTATAYRKALSPASTAPLIAG